MNIVLRPFLFLVLLLAAIRAHAQPVLTWDRTIGGSSWDELNGLLALPDGIIAAGSSRSGPGDLSWNFLIVKLDFDGNILWRRDYGGDQDDRLWDIIPTSDGGFLAGGYSYSGVSGDRTQPSRGDMDVWILKLDQQGQLLWERAYGGLYRDELFSMLEIPGGGYLLGCNSGSDVWMEKSEPSRGEQDFWLIRIDNQGNKLWDKTIGGSGYDQINDLAWAPDGNVYLSGGTVSEGSTGDLGIEPSLGLMDFWLGKFDLDTRQLIWDHRFGGSGEDYAYSLVLSQSGDKLYLGGRSGSPPMPITPFNNGKESPFYYGPSDFWLLELNLNGQKLREWSFGGAGLDDLYAIHQNPLGHLVIGGVSDSGIAGTKTSAPHGGYDYWLIGLDENFNQLWERTVGGTSNDALTRIAFRPDGSFVVGGHSDSDIGFEKTENNLGVNDFWVLSFECDLVADVVQTGIPSACSEETVALDATIPNCATCIYQWNTGSTESVIDIPSGAEDMFTVAVYDEFGCVAFDTVFVEELPPPDINLGPSDTILAHGSYLVVGSQNPDFQYTWSTGDTSATIRIEASGIYSVTVTDASGCTATDQIEVKVVNKNAVWVPNVFSPNLDGYNDYVTIYTDGSTRRVVTFQISDRWGTLVFRRDDFLLMQDADGWDGEYRGEPAPPGVYVWFAEIEYLDGSREMFEGSVTIVR